MNAWSDVFAPIVGRILVGGFFLWSGIQISLNFPSAVMQIQNLGLPWPMAITLLFILIEVLGGVALVVGSLVRPAALILALYTLVSGVLFTDFTNTLQEALFLQSIAVIGALFYISAKEKKEKSRR